MRWRTEGFAPVGRGMRDAGNDIYRLRNIDHTYQPTASLSDVYRFQLSLRYNSQ
ncbi:MAG TPA: hypothetical protein VH080_10905 [Gemmatimonadaceae bacterium]|nr:hypothetical protein [Gemmatimonadaceae bacterium]